MADVGPVPDTGAATLDFSLAGSQSAAFKYSHTYATEADHLKPALLIIDMLVDFLAAWPEADRAQLVDAIRTLVKGCRAAGRPIIWVRQEFEPDLSDAFRDMRRRSIRFTIKGTQGCKIIPELAPLPDDPLVIKKRYSAFFGTQLDQLLSCQATDSLVLAGIHTHACVRMTAIDAYQRDLDVIIPREAVSSYDREHGDVSLRYMDGKIASVVSLAIAMLRIAER
jgi:nicotinamidase-related amidase